MDNKQVIEQLKALRKFHNQFIETTEDIGDSTSKQLVEALDIAIKALEGTAFEVPVQERFIGKCQYCGKENEIELPANKDIVPKFCMNCSKEITYVKKER
ncbi:MAG: hypothetical protein ACLSTJ_05670 [Clostridium neonatale]